MPHVFEGSLKLEEEFVAVGAREKRERERERTEETDPREGG